MLSLPLKLAVTISMDLVCGIFAPTLSPSRAEKTDSRARRDMLMPPPFSNRVSIIALGQLTL